MKVVGGVFSSASSTLKSWWGIITTGLWIKERSKRKALEDVLEVKHERDKIRARPKFRADELWHRMLKRKRKDR